MVNFISSRRTQHDGAKWSRSVAALFFVAVLAASIGHSMAAENPAAPASPLQLYNDGTKKLREGKLQEAEACLQSALASQEERIQPPALYNLGETRFRSGAEDLKKGPKPEAAKSVTQDAMEIGGSVLKEVDQALASDNLDVMVSAYLRGRGARRDLKGAMEVVKKALETYNGVLTKWQRSAGDFKSSYELSPADADSKTNADVVERNIARLIDLQQMMMQAMMGLGKQRSELAQKMAALKKKMPESKGSKLKGKGDEDDDGEDKQSKEPEAGDKEPSQKEGHEMQLAPEEARHLLDMLKLDSNRKLSMGGDKPGKPQDRKGRDW